MSDTRLRKLERRWRETGAVEDEATYLAERVRTGEITQQMLDAAIICEHPAAILVTGWTRSKAEPFHVQIEKLGGAVLVRAALACASFALQYFEREQPRLVSHPRAVLILAIQYVLNPPTGRKRLELWLEQYRDLPDWAAASPLVMCINNGRFNAIVSFIDCVLCEPTSEENAARDFRTAYDLLTPSGNRLDPHIACNLIAWALGNDPLPALLARLEAEAANATPITPPG